jgi:hypothetical protein
MDIQMEINASAEALEASFEQRIVALERRIDELAALCVSASAKHAPEPVTKSRKTLPTAMTTLLAKQGVTIDPALASVEAGAIDQALTPLSIEQRIAVKAQLLRSGLLS